MSIFSQPLLDLAAHSIQLMEAKGFKLSIAESCTGGLLSGLITSIPGSSSTLDRCFVTYSNESKAQSLMVSPNLLIAERYGAVSAETAESMVNNVRRLSRSQVGISITGIAGPGRESTNKSIGLVYFGISIEGKQSKIHKEHYGNIGREEIRLSALETVLKLLIEGLTDQSWAAFSGSA